MATMEDVESAEKCPICPSSGPPTRERAITQPAVANGTTESDLPASSTSGAASTAPANASTSSDAESFSSDELVWIACSKCSTWFHSACLLLASEPHRLTVPQAIRAVLDDHEGEWTNWTNWVDRWYCRECIDWCTSPDNPRPPHHLLKATLKAGCPPRPAGVGAGNKKRAEEDEGPGGGPSKRARLSSAVSSVDRDRDAVTGKDDADIGADGGSSASRPKRKAAENAPDYRAWNHGIPTPTNNWLRLIEDPGKYGKEIRWGDFPRVKGEMLTREWLESAGSTHGKGENGVVKIETDRDADGDGVDGSTSVRPPTSAGRPSSAMDDRLPPSAFYGPDRRPILVRPEDGGIESMGAKLPDKKLRVADVAEIVGRNMTVDIIDVATQSSVQWNLGKWAEYFTASLDPSWSGKVYNIISLEITGTPLAKRVTPPRIVREIDWVDNFWNFDIGAKRGKQVNGHAPAQHNGSADAEDDGVKSAGQGRGKKGKETPEGTNGTASGKQETGKEKVEAGGWKQDNVKPGFKWPKVQLYCLMGIRGSWTDWHVDFAASSVYYSIHTGAKEFYFIKPTENNLKAYAQWSGSAELQQSKWLGDMCEGGVEKVRLEAGDTMIIPSGYIHAVYTPENSIVFGGNFLHSYNIATQLRLRSIEIETKVPQRFRFPMLEKLCWYVADRYCSDLRHLRAIRLKSIATPLHPPHVVVLRELLVLADFLQGQVDMLENEELEEKRRKMVYERIPGEIVKDPVGLVRELRWRVERELPAEGRPVVVAGRASEGEGGGVKAEPRDKGPEAERGAGTGPGAKKRTLEGKMVPPVSRTTGFKPRPWTTIENPPSEITTSREALPRPDSTARTVKKGDARWKVDSDAGSQVKVENEAAEPGVGIEDAAAGPNAESAEVTKEVARQCKSRQYVLVDGSTVLEEVEVVLTQKRTVWGSPPQQSEGTSA